MTDKTFSQKKVRLYLENFIQNDDKMIKYLSNQSEIGCMRHRKTVKFFNDSCQRYGSERGRYECLKYDRHIVRSTCHENVRFAERHVRR